MALCRGPGSVLLLTGVVAGVLADGGAALSFRGCAAVGHRLAAAADRSSSALDHSTCRYTYVRKLINTHPVSGSIQMFSTPPSCAPRLCLCMITSS